MNNLIAFILSAIFVVIVTILAVSSGYVIYPAYKSFQISCRPDTINISKYTIGSVKISANTNIPSNTFFNTSIPSSIKVTLPNNSDVKLIKHENCHLNQFIDRKWYSGCNQPFRHYLMEIECYSTQYLPNGFYNKFYKKYLTF
jgi:hypothetical protein